MKSFLLCVLSISILGAIDAKAINCSTTAQTTPVKLIGNSANVCPTATGTVKISATWSNGLAGEASTPSVKDTTFPVSFPTACGDGTVTLTQVDGVSLETSVISTVIAVFRPCKPLLLP